MGIQKVSYNFVKIAALDGVSAGSMVDVLAVVKDAQAVSQFRSNKTQKDLTKKDMTLVDNSGASVRRRSLLWSFVCVPAWPFLPTSLFLLCSLACFF